MKKEKKLTFKITLKISNEWKANAASASRNCKAFFSIEHISRKKASLSRDMRTGNFQMSTLRVIRGTLHENVPYMFHMWNKNAFTSELLKHWNSPWRLFFARKPIPSGWNTRATYWRDLQFVNHSTNVQKLFLEKRVRGESWNSLEKFLNQLTLTFVPLERIFRGTTKVASVTDTRPEADVTRSWIVRKENIGISLVESSIMEHLSNHLRRVKIETYRPLNDLTRWLVSRLRRDFLFKANSFPLPNEKRVVLFVYFVYVFIRSRKYSLVR